MINFFEILKNCSESEETLLMGVYYLIIFASVFDWLLGWVNARFNDSVEFKSHVALYGIVKKMMYFIVLVLFMSTAYILLDEKIAFTSVFILNVGFLISEISSITAHLGKGTDGKKHDLFIDFIKKLQQGNNK